MERNPKMSKKVHGIKMIRDDEYEVFSTHASIVPVLLKGIPLLLAGIAVTVITHLWQHDTNLTVIVGLVCLGIVILTRVPGCLRAIVEPIVVSNRRLYLRKGIIDIDDHIATLSNISDIQVDPTIIGRMFGYADVNIQTIAGEQDFEMKSVSKAYTLRDHILRISDEGQGGMGGQYPNQQYQQYPPQQNPQQRTTTRPAGHPNGRRR